MQLGEDLIISRCSSKSISGPRAVSHCSRYIRSASGYLMYLPKMLQLEQTTGRACKTLTISPERNRCLKTISRRLSLLVGSRSFLLGVGGASYRTRTGWLAG